MALSAISNAKSISEFAVEGLSLAATNISGQEKKNEILCSAAKKGIFLVNHRFDNNRIPLPPRLSLDE